MRHAADTRDDAPAHLGIGAEVDTMADVWAGDIEFQCHNARHPFETIGQLHKLHLIRAGNAHDHRRTTVSQEGQLLAQKSVDAVIVEADRVEQTGRRFHSPPRHVALPGQRGDCLRHDAAEPLQVDEPDHLAAVPKCAGSDEDGIGQPQPAERYREVDRAGR